MIEQILQADRHLQVDQVEQARNIYQRVVDVDPGNAIAVVGLARCALAEGEDRQAYELASRALEIDPENDMARRMEARLSEILKSRGETVERPGAAATPNPHEMREVVTEETGDDPTRASGEPGSTGTHEPAPGAQPAPRPESAPTASPAPGAQPAPRPESAATTSPAPMAAGAHNDREPTKRAPTTPHAAKERPVRKSLFDRLMGR